MKLNRLILFTVWFGSVARSDDAPIYTICELLATPEKFDGMMLRVRATSRAAEGTWLVGDFCPVTVTVGKAYVAKAIFLAYRSDRGATVVRRDAHMQAVDKIISKMLRRGVKEVELTYNGIFETRTKWQVWRDSSGEERLLGFGHLGVFPAQLVLVDYADPQETRPQSKLRRQ